MKKSIIIIIITLFLIFFWTFWFIKIPKKEKMEILERRVVQHLEYKGIGIPDIKLIEVYYNPKFKRGPTAYMCVVILKNNQKIKYLYYISRNNELIEEVHTVQ
ncbi:hypothetical protein [Cytobacillus dafuensis]|uniref:DUF3139 domain-containing protein n=1 Tax=Cytobacillus dafuensis TaxID=1742359 RepID=A0A5B8YZA9_CYTDA|nr:hypothetical protein [Cytobacillus dafuensis]QED46022.1 hypothetical protein FSZ17_01150 [Cytobacillus dafuensis]